MRPALSKQMEHGLTRFEVLVVVPMTFLVFVLFAMALPVYEAAHRRADRITCVENLKQINLALRIWEGDTGNSHSMIEPLTNQDMTDLNGGQLAWVKALRLFSPANSNKLSDMKILQCPADKRLPPTNGLKIRISYFLNLDASEMYPRMILSGDDNLAIGDGVREGLRPVDGPAKGDVPVKPGIVDISSNMVISWTLERHVGVGNLVFADGSVAEESENGLLNARVYSVQGTPVTTNCWAIP